MLRLPLQREALRSAALFSGALALAALLAGSVRVLPWLLEPGVPLRVAMPFARGIAEVAVESAVLLGWPLGWAMAAERFADRGEARVLALLGESPARSTLRLWRSALPLAAVLVAASLLGGRDAAAPGRIANDLIAQGERACATAPAATTYAVPFVGATWLCAPARTPRLYGHGPGAMSGAVFCAAGAHIAGDMRRIDMREADLLLGHTALRVRQMTLRGLPPWAQASGAPAWLRALVLLGAAMIAAFLATEGMLRRLGRGPLAAVVIGAVGPLAALGVMRALERGDARAGWYAVIPLVAAGATWLTQIVAVRVGRRRWSARA